MLITLILLIAMLGAIILATGSVEEGKTPSSVTNKVTNTPVSRFCLSRATTESLP